MSSFPGRMSKRTRAYRQRRLPRVWFKRYFVWKYVNDLFQYQMITESVYNFFNLWLKKVCNLLINIKIVTNTVTCNFIFRLHLDLNQDWYNTIWDNSWLCNKRMRAIIKKKDRTNNKENIFRFFFRKYCLNLYQHTVISEIAYCACLKEIS